ncbi:MAG: isochorismatase family protein [Anaerolineales bacterium]
MKEVYFTAEDIRLRAREMLEEVFPDGQKRRLDFQPEQAALLVLDVQDYFLDPASHAFIPSAQAIVPQLNQIIRQFYACSLPVLFTQHLNTEEDAGGMKTWWRDLITRDHPYRALHNKLDREGAEVFEKSQYDAFYGTDLEHWLRKRGVSQVLIGGVMTHLCCETTARSAFMRGFDVFFLVDGTATYHRSYHLGTLRNLGHGFATLILTEDVKRVFTRGAM